MDYKILVLYATTAIVWRKYRHHLIGHATQQITLRHSLYKDASIPSEKQHPISR